MSYLFNLLVVSIFLLLQYISILQDILIKI